MKVVGHGFINIHVSCIWYTSWARCSFQTWLCFSVCCTCVVDVWSYHHLTATKGQQMKRIIVVFQALGFEHCCMFSFGFWEGTWNMSWKMNCITLEQLMLHVYTFFYKLIIFYIKLVMHSTPRNTCRCSYSVYFQVYIRNRHRSMISRIVGYTTSTMCVLSQEYCEEVQ